MATVPKSALPEANRAARREMLRGHRTADQSIFARVFGQGVERRALTRVAAARKDDPRYRDRRYADPCERRWAREARLAEASQIAHELYPVIDRARGLG